MEFYLIPPASFFISILTFFSGFGMGTLLTPVFILFFPPDLAIALTGIVHFFNNIFKVILTGKNADKEVLIKFGIPSMLAAILGALLLLYLANLPPLFSYSAFGKTYATNPIKFIIGILLIFFALLELVPWLKNMQFGRDKLILGGFLSGFFGGLSGNQGALRSAFLMKAGLSKESFIATAVLASAIVDITRLGIYSTRYLQHGVSANSTLLLLATTTAIVGAFIGNYLLKKITIEAIQKLIAIFLIFLSIAFVLGIL